MAEIKKITLELKNSFSELIGRLDFNPLYTISIYTRK